MIEDIRRLKPAVEKTLSTTASMVAGRGNDRWEVIVQNKDAAISVTVGTETAVAGSSAVTLAPGEIYRHMGREELWAKAASGAPKLSVVEVVGPGNHNRTVRNASVTLATSAKRVLDKDRSRRHATIENRDAAIAVTVGAEGVTAGNGIVIAAGKSLDLYGGGEVWAVAASGTPVVAVVEEGSR